MDSASFALSRHVQHSAASYLFLQSRCQFHQHFTCGFFCTKVLHKVFSCSHLTFELFLAQEYWHKCTYKMLVTLTRDRKHIALKYSDGFRRVILVSLHKITYFFLQRHAEPTKIWAQLSFGSPWKNFTKLSMAEFVT